MWTFISSGLGVSGGGSLAQLDTFSTELNLRSDNGLCRPIVVLQAFLSVCCSKEPWGTYT